MRLNIDEVRPVVNQDGTREVHVIFGDGRIVNIAKCYESWEQWGAPADYRWKSVTIANRCNDWLHGKGVFPY